MWNAKLLMLLRDEKGQDMVEYALVVALVGLASIVTMNTFANTLTNAFGTIGNKLLAAISAS